MAVQPLSARWVWHVLSVDYLFVLNDAIKLRSLLCASREQNGYRNISYPETHRQKTRLQALLPEDRKFVYMEWWFYNPSQGENRSAIASLRMLLYT